MKKVIGIGLGCIDQLVLWKDIKAPVAGNKAVQVDLQGGGMTATALVAASRLGVKAEFWGAVGDDLSGRFIIEELKREGVDTSQVVKVKNGRGPSYLICIDSKTGERYFMGGNPLNEPCKTIGNLSRLKQAGCLLIDSSRIRNAAKAVRMARKLNIPVVFDTGYFKGENEKLLPFTDYLIAPEFCSARLGAGNDFRKACRILKERGIGTVIITLGKRGLIAYDGISYIRLKAFKVPIVDTTGAGDVFHGAFCCGIIRKFSLRDNLIFASAVAALKCRKLGGRAGIPSIPEVEKFLNENGYRMKKL